MNYILFDDISWENLLPLTFTRPVSDIRIGILTIREKWNMELKTSVSILTKDYLSEKFNLIKAGENILINGSLLPDSSFIEEVMKLKIGELLFQGETVLAGHLNEEQLNDFQECDLLKFKRKETVLCPMKISFPWDIFTFNGNAIEEDMKRLTKGRASQPISITNSVRGRENIFIEEGAIVECSIINAETGPVYIGKDAEIMEGCIIRGPLVLCEHSTLKMGAKIYGATTIGPHCKVGGEVSNSIFFGYSNKAHDGFLGNAVLGEWCNLGASTNNSNLKNNYEEVRVWNYHQERFVKTGLLFCGLIMGDHSKSAINMMFNTGTVVGVCCNIFGIGFSRNFVPSFSYGGGSHGLTENMLEKVYATAEKVIGRRQLTHSDVDKKILQHVFELTKKYRKF